MSVPFYFDEHVHFAITLALRQRGVDVITVQEDAHDGSPDALVIDRATQLGRVAFSQDEDFLREAVLRQRLGRPFSGVIYAHQLRVTIGQCISELELISLATEPDEYWNRIEYLPL